jgi:hypothetical protein
VVGAVAVGGVADRWDECGAVVGVFVGVGGWADDVDEPASVVGGYGLGCVDGTY